MCVVWSFTAPQRRNREIQRGREVLDALSCSDKVSNITISPSSPKNCYKPISKIAPIYLAKTVSSSRRQSKLLGWIMSVSFGGVYQRGSITHGPKSEIGRQQHLSLSTAGSWCAATAQDTRWCPVTLRHGNTGSCKTPGHVDTGTWVVTPPRRRKNWLWQSGADSFH